MTGGSHTPQHVCARRLCEQVTQYSNQFLHPRSLLEHSTSDWDAQTIIHLSREFLEVAPPFLPRVCQGARALGG